MRLAMVLVAGVMFLAGCGNDRETIPIETSTVSLFDELMTTYNKVAAGLPQEARPGAKLFFLSGCLTCHTYAGTGSRNLGAPDLTHEGTKNRGLRFQIRHLRCPSCVTPNSPMPPFRSLGDENIRKLSIFLEASR